MPLPKSYPVSGDQAGSAKKRMLNKRYAVGKKLGSGHFGTAFLVTDIKANNERKVLKEISVGDIKPDETVDAVKEARLLAKLDNPFIVKFHDSFLEDEKFCIITEYCEGGDLDIKIQARKAAGRPFELSLILDWFVQLTNAVRYIHERRILHRDLKTRNIFLKNNHIKLGDFGISRILMGTSDMATTFTGTPYYMSPEVLKHDGYNSKSDVWSLGAILYELCTLEHAFQAQSLMAVMYKIVEGESPKLPDHFHSDLKKLFARLMNKNPQLRPSATEILQDPFIKTHLQDLSHKMSIKLTSSKKETAEEAEAIAKALNPVAMKKKELLQESDPVRVMSPREKMKLRKQQKADLQAVEIAKATQQNLSEARKRYKERKLKEARVVAPWVEEHPDVFNDPDFSVSMTANNTCHADDMEVSLPQDKYMDLPNDALLGNGDNTASKTMESMEIAGGGVGFSTQTHQIWNKQDTIPEDPLLAETHYTEYDDFEDDDECSDLEDSQDDYEALVECIEDALDLPSDPDVVPITPEVVPGEVSPFTPLARDQKIKAFTSQCIAIYGEESFRKLHRFLYEARSNGTDEVAIIAGLKRIVNNTRDCFLIDQLIFLEKQHSQ